MTTHPAGGTETNLFSDIAYLDDSPLRRTRPTMWTDPRDRTDELESYRQLATAVLMTALVDLGRVARGLRISKDSPNMRLAPSAPLDVDARAAAVHRATALVHDAGFAFWCSVVGVNAEHLITGTLQRIVAGQALNFEHRANSAPQSAVAN